jgi:hypothetical protein
MISESDWKKFKIIKENALERFCSEAIADVKEGLSESENSNINKVVCLYMILENYNKRIRLLFDDHARSKAQMQLIMYRSEGLVTDDEIQSLSEELQNETKP